MFANSSSRQRTWTGKPSVVNVICLVAEKVEELGIHDCHNEIEGVIGIGNDDEQCRLPVSDGVQFHFIVAHQLPQLCNVEGRKPCAAGNQNRLRVLPAASLYLRYCLTAKWSGIAGFQLVEHDIHRVLEGLIVLSGFAGALIISSRVVKFSRGRVPRTRCSR